MNVVLNQYAAKKLGFKSPQDAVGKVVKSELFEPGTGMVNINIIGVVGDIALPLGAHADRPDHVPKPAQGPGSDDHPLPRRSRRQSKRPIERQWKQITNDVPFEAKFSEDIIRELYKAEDSRAQIFAAFSLLAVIIGCLGLFGLAAFTAERRTKEIGIRKVLGARTRDIVRLLVWQFSRPVIIANVIAWPVAWWLMRDWLNGFDQRISLTPVPFIVAAAVALGHRDRNGGRSCGEGRAGQSDPRFAVRVNVPGKSPSVWRVVVIAAVSAVLTSAMTPAAQAVAPVKKVAAAKKRPVTTAPKGGGGGGPQSLDWAINAMLRP